MNEPFHSDNLNRVPFPEIQVNSFITYDGSRIIDHDHRETMNNSTLIHHFQNTSEADSHISNNPVDNWKNKKTDNILEELEEKDMIEEENKSPIESNKPHQPQITSQKMILKSQAIRDNEIVSEMDEPEPKNTENEQEGHERTLFEEVEEEAKRELAGRPLQIIPEIYDLLEKDDSDEIQKTSKIDLGNQSKKPQQNQLPEERKERTKNENKKSEKLTNIQREEGEEEKKEQKKTSPGENYRNINCSETKIKKEYEPRSEKAVSNALQQSFNEILNRFAQEHNVGVEEMRRMCLNYTNSLSLQGKSNENVKIDKKLHISQPSCEDSIPLGPNNGSQQTSRTQLKADSSSINQRNPLRPQSKPFNAVFSTNGSHSQQANSNYERGEKQRTGLRLGQVFQPAFEEEKRINVAIDSQNDYYMLQRNFTSNKKVNIIPRDLEPNEQEALSKLLNSDKLICSDGTRCKIHGCEDIHAKSICAQLDECQGDCRKVHFRDLILTLITTEQLTREEIFGYLPDEEQLMITTLDFRDVAAELEDKRMEQIHRANMIRKGNEADDPAEARTSISDQKRAIKEKILQIELISENYLKSVGKIIFNNLRDFRENIESIVEDMKTEAACALKLLPIYSKKFDIMKFLEDENPEQPFMVLSGETGSGKSTQLPIYILQHLRANRSLRRAAIVQPRKLSAIALATRVRQELSVKMSTLVGYDVGTKKTDQDYSSETKILFMSDKRFIEKMIKDPSLSEFSFVVVDEAHERTISSDTVLGVLRKRLYKERVRENLKVIVASATIDVTKFSVFLGNARELQIIGRQFPITTKYQPIPSLQQDRILEVKRCITRILTIKDQILKDRTKYFKKDPTLNVDTNVMTGHMLVFLPSLKEMEKLKELLIKEKEHNEPNSMLPFKVIKFHAKMHPKRYNEVFEKVDPEKTTKIILASKIAETSLTFEDLSIVIDTGFDGDSYYNPLRGFDEFRLDYISKSAAKQRAGRAGRTRPGICYRLYPIEVYNYKFLHSKVPDFVKSNIEQPILILKRLQVEKIEEFELLDSIPRSNIEKAESNLISYNALDEEKRITSIGITMSEITNEPFFSRPLFRAVELGVFCEVAKIVAMLKHASSLFFWSDNPEEFKKHQLKLWNELSKKYGSNDIDAQGDHIFYLFLFEAFLELHKPKRDSDSELLDDPAKAWCSDNKLIYHSFKSVYETHEGLEKTFHKEPREINPEKLSQTKANLILECLLTTHNINICCYSDDLTLGYILTREKNKLENISIHSNSLCAKKAENDGKEPTTPWIFFSELHDYGHLIAYSVTRLTENQLKYFTRFEKLKDRIEEIKESMDQHKSKIFTLGSCGTSFMKKFEDKMTELSRWRLENKIFYKVDHKIGLIHLWNLAFDEKTKAELVEVLKRLKADLSKERLEIELNGVGGVVFTKGAKIVDLLVNTETVTLFADGLDKEITSSDLKTAIESQLGADGLHQVTVNTDQQTYRKSAVIVLSDKKCLQTYLNRKIKVKNTFLQLQLQDSGQRNDSVKSVKVRVSWFKGKSQGKGAIFVDDPEEGAELARKLKCSPIIWNQKIRAWFNKETNKIRLDNLPTAIDDTELREILEKKYQYIDYRHCCVYRSPYASDQDDEQEQKQVFEFVDSKAKKLGGKLSDCRDFKSKCTYAFSFPNFEDAAKFIKDLDNKRIQLSVSDRNDIEKMIHAKPWIMNPDFSIFKDCYKALEKEFEFFAKELNEKYREFARVVLPNPQLIQGERPFIWIRIEPASAVSNIRILNQKISEIRQKLNQIAQGAEITSLSEHRLYSVIFSSAYEKGTLQRLNEEFKVFISAHKSRTLMIYGHPENVKKAEAAIKADLDERKEFMVGELDLGDFDASLLIDKGLPFLQRQIPNVFLNLKVTKGSFSLELFGEVEDVQEAYEQICMKLEPATKSEYSCNLCNTTRANDPKILHCGHLYCFRCIKQYMSALCKMKDAKWLCFKKDCKKEIVVRDIIEILPLDELRSFLSHVITKKYLKEKDCPYTQCTCGQIILKSAANGQGVICEHYTLE